MYINKIYNENFVEGIKKIENKSIDLVVTDPPYLHVKGGMSNKKMKGVWDKDSSMVNELSDFGEKEIYEFLDLVIPKMKKVNMYIFCSKLQLQYYFVYIKEKKLKYDLLIWDKVNYSMKSSKFFTSDIEYVVRIYESGVSLNKITNKQNKKNDISYYLKRQSFKKPKEFNHNTEKPIQLIERYIKLSSNENDLVLDLFMGTGTTAIACIENNRNYIGFEINKVYYDLIINRIEDRKNMLF